MAKPNTPAKLQDRILDLVTGNQDKVLDVVKTIVEKAEPVTGKLPRRPLPKQVPSASQVIDKTFGLGDRLLTSQKSFAHKLVDVLAKPSSPTASRAKKAAPAVKTA